MKKISLLLSLTLVVAGVFSAAAENGRPVTRRGTSVLHYLTRNDLVATADSSNVVGTLRLQFNEQGNSSKQSLHLRVFGLEPDSNYGLTAIVGDDTNAVPVAPLTSDAKGRIRTWYFSRGGVQGNGHKIPVPDPLSPLTDVRAIGLENANTQSVAYAWIADAERFQYLVKRNLTPADPNGSAAGSISLIANHRHVNFRLLAGGLNPTNDYHLALNSNIVSTVAADEGGYLRLRDWPSNAPAVLALRSLELLDANSNAVLSTTLPR